MSNVTRAGSRIRRLGVGVITLLVAAPIAFILFAMTLMVVEFVMFPLASLVIAVVTALIASWAAWRLAGDGMRTDINKRGCTESGVGGLSGSGGIRVSVGVPAG